MSRFPAEEFRDKPLFFWQESLVLRLVMTCWLLVAGLGAAQQQVLVEEVVAVVNREVITRSDVYQEAILVLVERRGVEGLGLQMTSEFLSHVLELLINQRVLLHEANRLGMPLEDDQNREALLEKFKRWFQDQEEYQQFLLTYNLTEGAVIESSNRHIRVERLKERKLQTIPGVSDEEVRRYYQINREQLGGVSFEFMEQPIRLKLLTQRGRRVLSKWIQEVRRRSQVKVLVDLEKKSG